MTRDLAVGAVVLLAVFIFTIGIFSIGSQQRVWVAKVGYLLRVPDANGLQSGSPVRLAGVQIGIVNGIRFPDDPNVTAIDVELSIDHAHQHRIRQDTVANLRILTLLGGEKYVELVPGTPSLPALPPGSYIEVPESFGMEKLGELSAGLADDIKSISGNVRVVLETVQRQEGVVGRMLLDPNFGQEVFTDIGQSAKIMRRRMEDIDSGRGLAGRLLSDDAYARETTESIKVSLKKIETLLDRLTAEQGVVDQVLDPNGKAVASLDNLHRATANLADFTADLKEGKGTLGRLVGDEQYGRDLLDNIKKISENLAAVTQKLNEGQGTMSGLINDPEVYEGLKSVVRGVQESKILSGLVRHYREKGEKAKRKEEERLRKEQEPGAKPKPAPPPGGDGG
ncbi:MAG TPA: MlaD family protein [Candidatus Polarisedimenticolia bacterium]|nr:MlaD family protein [Candidatus Polarisedimenticolia bacterium]